MQKQASGINVFQKYLTVWVALCMVTGVAIGKFLPEMPDFLGKFDYAGISIPMAILIWLMIYPMMMKVDFKSVKNVGRNPKVLFVTWIVNWLIKPFSMYAVASLFFFVIFKGVITPDLATEYLAGAVLLGAAPCTAMVFVWSTLTKGSPAYTVVQVATNDLIILVAFVPIVKFLLGVFRTLPFRCQRFLFVVIPLAGGILTRIFIRTRLHKLKSAQKGSEIRNNADLFLVKRFYFKIFIQSS
jgi:ACR3 family arsenite transporter